jgi:tRNA(Ile)-lysidine synthase
VIELNGVPAGARVVVACSGGADSLALLVMACDAGFDVVAVYVDHGLRASTDFDAEVVAAAATRFGAQHRIERVDVGHGANLEARARDARYAALERARASVGAVAVLLGHTRDDQAETVLLNLLRGSGTSGLAGMATRRGTLYRPLLAMRRADTHELCASMSLVPISDPMNDELQHRRVWLRREVIPMLEQGASRDLVEVLARQAELLRDDDELLDALARSRATEDAREIAEMPPALARRVLRQWLGAPPPSAATIDRVLAVARGESRATELPGGARVERVGGQLAHLVPNGEHVPASVELPFPGRVRFGDVELEAWVEHAAPAAWPDGRTTAVCDADRVGGVATVRAPVDGERFHPLGRSGTKLVRDALAEAGVPAGRRARAPIVVGDEPIWVVGYRIDDRVRVTYYTRRYLWMSAERVENDVTSVDR